jgi:glutamate/tyrosine decarboxylase-like PLP-dependent enzyme
MQPSEATLPALKTAAEAALDYAAAIDDRRVAPDAQALAGLQDLQFPLGDAPIDAAEVIRSLHAHGSPATVASSGGRFFGLVVGATLPAALGARVLASAWDQVVFNDATSPVGCALERCAGEWIKELIGLPTEAHVSFVTGATMANFVCLAAAREKLLSRAAHNVSEHGLWGAPKLRVISSAEAHVTVVKALTMLGWGTAEIERVPTDEQGRMIADRLPALDDRTIVCAQAGNVNSGSFDPFEAICSRAASAGAWVHVDGAFGLWAAAAPARRGLTRGVTGADSWALDGHKWLNTPYDCGMAIVRDPKPLHTAMATQAPYLQTSVSPAPKDMGPEFSRSARGVEVWAALRSLGRRGLADLIDGCCIRAAELAIGLQANGFTVLNDVVLNLVVARIGTPEEHARIVQHAQGSGECWFGTTVWRGQSAIRLAVSSWKTSEEDIRRTVAAIGEASRAVQNGP